MQPRSSSSHLHVMRPSWSRPGPDLRYAAAPDLEPLFGLRSFDYKRYTIGTGGLSKMTDPGPPSYGISELFMVTCAKRYAASLGTGRILIGDIEEHPAPCAEGLYPDQAGIQALFQGTMDRYGPVWGPPSGR